MDLTVEKMRREIEEFRRRKEHETRRESWIIGLAIAGSFIGGGLLAMLLGN